MSEPTFSHDYLRKHFLWMAHSLRGELPRVHLDRLQDITRLGNSVMCQYFLEENPDLSVADIVEFLQDPATFTDILNERKPFVLRNHEAALMTNQFGTFTGLGGYRSDDFYSGGFGGSYFAGDLYPASTELPSGKTIHYFLLINEQTANTSAFMGAFSFFRNTESRFKKNPEAIIVLRESSLRGRRALALATKRDIHPDFCELLPAVLYFHELSHDPLLGLEEPWYYKTKREGKVRHFWNQETARSCELIVERYARRRLHQAGIPDRVYLDYHRLRQSPESEDVSRLVLQDRKRTYQPGKSSVPMFPRPKLPGGESRQRGPGSSFKGSS